MPSDQELNTLLDSLLVRLAGTGSRVVFGLDAWPEAKAEALASFLLVGLIEPAERADSTICPGCDKACLMPVEIGAQTNGRVPKAHIFCDKPEACGQIEVLVESLERWAFTDAGVARALARCLRTDRAPTKSGSEGPWRLGTVGTTAGNRVEIVLAANAILPVEVDPSTVRVVLADAGDGLAMDRGVAVIRVLGFHNGQLVARPQSLARQGVTWHVPGSVVLEISYQNREVELVDRVADVRVTMAKPRLGSANDRLFDFLFQHPGHRWDLPALTAACIELPPGFPHKFLNNLGFVGDLRRAFFDASKFSIKLSRTLTQQQLEALGVSTASLLAAAKVSRRGRRNRDA